jgi:exportin-1
LVNSELQYVHFEWESILAIANQNADQLMLPEVIKGIDFIIKVNTKVAESVGFMYLAYLKRIFTDLLKMYGLYSQCISNSVKFRQNEHMIKPMKTVRRDILKLIQTYIEHADNYDIFNRDFLPTLQGLVEDYALNDPNARDPEVLHLFATMIKKMGESLGGYLQQIIVQLAESTLNMIKDDFMQYPEFREGCFKLVENIVKHCTGGLFQLGADKFQTILMTILFALKHEKPELMEIGLETMHALN